MNAPPPTPANVIKLGIHICRALELCAQRNTIHRDIKPDNIFISSYNEYKLGDFGVARHLERTSSGLSKKGTYTYMAPEVFRGEPYGSNIDTYSLGIVMYRLLNQNRAPFLPNFPQLIMPNDRDDALQKRLRGAPIPTLKNITPELNRIVRKACAFDRHKRFASPTKMREALEAVAKSQAYEVMTPQTILAENPPILAATETPSQPLPELSATYMASHTLTKPSAAHMASQPSAAHTASRAAPSPIPSHNARKKNRTKLIALLSSCGAVVIAVIIGLFVWVGSLNNSGDLNVSEDQGDPQGQEQSSTLSNDDLTIISVGGGFNHTMAIKHDHSLWAWGENQYGQLGDSTKTNKSTPVKIMDDVMWGSAGGDHTFAIKKDGSLWGWGRNQYGQLGDSTKTDRSTPVKIMDDVVQVSGSFHSLAIKKDGSLWAWGWNIGGQLGDGTTTDKSTPVKIMDDIAQVSAGSGHTLAVKNDGSLWAWGANASGQLGDGTIVNKSTPVKIMDDVAQVSIGVDHTLAIKKDGTLWAWGANHSGQLGDGTMVGKAIPVKIMDDVAQVSANVAAHTLAVKKDGSLWVWGNGEDGRLGDGTTVDKAAPVKIMDDVAQVSTGHYHSLAIKKDGSLWVWGGNMSGQLGDGMTTNRSTPAKIDL
ncbi:MAG: protein kinase [Peptococcaceae bacterium]|nr:protein kinase [Peptococcaceae bacterium]